ncbi:hypothetical protein MAR_020552 [Mya arenaria]|uniref:Uncharacterized protein n=1 Tax=Mya arenaria TaxID=6604 RepID=A0ABY7E8U7_MYAAR|nr:hypothetical protein MAR_020552 [Mya arenaria]
MKKPPLLSLKNPPLERLCCASDARFDRDGSEETTLGEVIAVPQMPDLTEMESEQSEETTPVEVIAVAQMPDLTEIESEQAIMIWRYI